MAAAVQGRWKVYLRLQFRDSWEHEYHIDKRRVVLWKSSMENPSLYECKWLDPIRQAARFPSVLSQISLNLFNMNWIESKHVQLTSVPKSIIYCYHIKTIEPVKKYIRRGFMFSFSVIIFIVYFILFLLLLLLKLHWLPNFKRKNLHVEIYMYSHNWMSPFITPTEQWVFVLLEFHSIKLTSLFWWFLPPKKQLSQLYLHSQYIIRHSKDNHKNKSLYF